VSDIILSDFLPLGHVNDGSVDYTTHIQRAFDVAISSGARLIVPPGRFRVSGAGLLVNMASNQRLAVSGAGGLTSVIINGNGSVIRLRGLNIAMSDIGLLSTTGGHTVLQTGIVALSTFARVHLSQESGTYSIWDNAGQEFVQNDFVNCVMTHSTSANTHAFNLVGAGGTINNNAWRGAAARMQNSGTKHAFNIESTSLPAQVGNVWDGLVFEVCLGGGIRLRGVAAYRVTNCSNWDAHNTPVINDFFDFDVNASGTNTYGIIDNIERRDGSMAPGKFDVLLPTAGGGAGTEVRACRSASANDPFLVNARGNPIVFTGIPGIFSVSNSPGQCGIDPTQGLILGGQKVTGGRGAAIPLRDEGSVIDSQARDAIREIIARLKATGGHGLIAD
jgi:hypothetical protein